MIAIANTHNKLLTQKQAAKYCNTTTSTIRFWQRGGRLGHILPYQRIRGFNYYDPKELDKFLELQSINIQEARAERCGRTDQEIIESESNITLEPQLYGDYKERYLFLKYHKDKRLDSPLAHTPIIQYR